MTAFYMFRMYFSTFEGEFRGNNEEIKEKLLQKSTAPVLAFGPGAMDPHELDHGHNHDAHHSEEPHESPWTMTIPLMVLAVPSMIIGFLGTPFNNLFEKFIHAPGESLEQIVEELAEFDLTEFLIMGGNSVGIALIGITVASLMYLSHKIDPAAIANKYPTLYNLSLNKWYLDDINELLFVKGCRRLARQVMEVDFKIVDGAVNLAGFVALISGEGLKYIETGRAQFYALIIFVGVIGLVVFSGIS
jgi:NAD(P)H-quinone oxidoreductase subunit 5